MVGPLERGRVDADLPRPATRDQPADHRRGRRRRFAQRLEQRRLVLRRDGEQEPAGGLRVHAEDPLGGARSSAHSTGRAPPRGSAGCRRARSPRAARLQRVRQDRQRFECDLRAPPGSPPACSPGGRRRPKPVTSVAALTPTRSAARAAPSFSVVIERTASPMPALDQRVALERGRQDAGAERLGEHEHVAGAGSRVGEHPVGVDVAQDHHAEERLEPNRSSGRRASGSPPRATTAERPGEHLAQQLEGELVPRPADEVEGEERRAAHRVDVAQRVRRRDGAPGAWRRPRSG